MEMCENKTCFFICSDLERDMKQEIGGESRNFCYEMFLKCSALSQALLFLTLLLLALCAVFYFIGVVRTRRSTL